MNKYKKDYLALQNLWNVCALRYLGSMDKNERMSIVDDFRDTLINIKDEGVQAIRRQYDKWEENEWIPFCKSKLIAWIHNNTFESQVESNKIQEFESIKMDYNYMRYRKIMQLIQDSGIGLGQGSSGKGYYAGPENIEKFTRSSE